MLVYGSTLAYTVSIWVVIGCNVLIEIFMLMRYVPIYLSTYATVFLYLSIYVDCSEDGFVQGTKLGAVRSDIRGEGKRHNRSLSSNRGSS